MLHCFVKKAITIRAQQIIADIAKIAISAHELQTPIYGFYRSSSSKLNKTLKEF